MTILLSFIELIAFIICVPVFAGEVKSIKSYKEKIALFNTFTDLNNTDFYKVPYSYEFHGVFKLEFPQEKIFHELYGMIHNPNSEIRAVSRTKDRIIFDTIYSTDQFSRRLNLTAPKKNQKKFLMLAGCSFTFGIGIPDNETLNHFINTQDSDYFSYNYGLAGASIGYTLALLKFDRSLESQLKFPKGDLVYFYIDSHLPRSVGSWPNVWMKDTPYFKPAYNNRMIYAGSVGQNYSAYRKGALVLADILPDSVKKNRIIPRISSADYEYYCSLVKEVETVWTKDLNKGKFLFVFHPLSVVDDNIVTCLKNQNIDYIIPTVPGTHAELSIPLDYHPNAKFNKQFSEKILNHLTQKSN